jgi:hypothetical protein
VSAGEGWRLLAAALAARTVAPPLLPRQPWEGALAPTLLMRDPAQPLALRLAAAMITDRPDEALALGAATEEEKHWRAVALRRAGCFGEARRSSRGLGERSIDADLFGRAREVLAFGEAGFRWAATTLALLRARGAWDAVWFVDACAAVEAGILSRETAALLEEIQRAELELMLLAGAAG